MGNRLKLGADDYGQPCYTLGDKIVQDGCELEQQRGTQWDPVVFRWTGDIGDVVEIQLKQRPEHMVQRGSTGIFRWPA